MRNPGPVRGVIEILNNNLSFNSQLSERMGKDWAQIELDILTCWFVQVNAKQDELSQSQPLGSHFRGFTDVHWERAYRSGNKLWEPIREYSTIYIPKDEHPKWAERCPNDNVTGRRAECA